jgi:hypothetical protein
MYLHHHGDPEDSFSTEDIQMNTPKFVEMTRPRRPDDYDEWPLQGSDVTVFPRRRLFADDDQSVDEPQPEPDPEPEPEPESDTVGHEESHSRNPFLTGLLSRGPLMAKPLVVNYATQMSLEAQFGLSRPTIRAVLATNK